MPPPRSRAITDRDEFQQRSAVVVTVDGDRDEAMRVSDELNQ